MNNINRNNYETFFLLYADNELCVAEKMAVEEFLRTNPDLQEELVMLQQSILKPDNIVFDDKESLLKKEFIATPLQEKLLLRLDNELPATERNAIDRLIKADADIEREWNMLQQTKLLPGSAIVFTDKKSLYRKEAGRVVAFPWWRVAVAAVFIGFGVWGGLVYFNKDTKVGDTPIAKNAGTKTIHDTGTVKLKAVVQTTAPSVASSTEKEKEIAATHLPYKRSSIEKITRSPEKVAPQRLTNREMQTIAENKKDNNLPQPYFDNVNSIGSNKTITAYVKPQKQSNAIVNSGNNDVAKNTNKEEPANTYVSTTSYTGSSEENNNRVLFMDEEKIKKTKLGGIFRKVKRVFERNANIKTGGNNIKVANLEFAIQ